MTSVPVAVSPAGGARSSRKWLPSSVVPTRPLPFVVSEKPAAPSFPLNQSRTVAGSAGLSKSTVTAPPLSPLASTAMLAIRSEEHTSELQSLMRISYAVFCLKQKKINKSIHISNKIYNTIHCNIQHYTHNKHSKH